VVRHDEDDPYLVVAADKGTATFSDIANAVSAEYGFWLGDAFASGGSQGYDHKKMGITARGAWESVKRHFRALGHDTQRAPFTVAGIGDMSGDVFGNGMLLSEHIRLQFAFDHRHIFIDPAPDAARALIETHRLRLQSQPLGIVKIDAASEAIAIQFAPKPPIPPERIIRFIQSRKDARLAGPDRLGRPGGAGAADPGGGEGVVVTAA
jgi:hypothetical protein